MPTNTGRLSSVVSSADCRSAEQSEAHTTRVSEQIGQTGRQASPLAALQSAELPPRIASRITIVNDCWTWTGSKNSDGYGRIHRDGRDLMAHRVVYEMLVGAIPPGLQTDHLCRNRGCVRPSHLELVTSRENTLRGVSAVANALRTNRCVHGHAFEGRNLIVRIRAGRHLRVCRVCLNDRGRRSKRKIRAAKATEL